MTLSKYLKKIIDMFYIYICMYITLGIQISFLNTNINNPGSSSMCVNAIEGNLEIFVDRKR